MNIVASNSNLGSLVGWRLMTSYMMIWWCHDESRLGLDLWCHRVGCHIYNCGLLMSHPINPLTMSSDSYLPLPPSSSSLGDSYFYLVSCLASRDISNCGISHHSNWYIIPRCSPFDSSQCHSISFPPFSVMMSFLFLPFYFSGFLSYIYILY